MYNKNRVMKDINEENELPAQYSCTEKIAIKKRNENISLLKYSKPQGMIIYQLAY